MYQPLDHAFMICAYKESPYLEECILSLLHQEVPSQVAISTSTPNEYIQTLAQKYGLEVHINSENPGITGDFNFAISKALATLVTLAHQDEIYEKGYTASMLTYVNSAKRPLLFFTDHVELRNDEIVSSNTLLRVKTLIAGASGTEALQSISICEKACSLTG